MELLEDSAVLSHSAHSTMQPVSVLQFLPSTGA